MQKPVKVLGKTIVPGPAKTSADKQCVHSILGMDASRAIPPEKVGIGQGGLMCGNRGIIFLDSEGSYR